MQDLHKIAQKVCESCFVAVATDRKSLYLVHFAIDSAYNWWQMVKIGRTAQNGKKLQKNRRRGAEQRHRAKIFEIRWSDGMVDQVKVRLPTGLIGRRAEGRQGAR